MSIGVFPRKYTVLITRYPHDCSSIATLKLGVEFQLITGEISVEIWELFLLLFDKFCIR